jgi:hypothetical protein
MSAVLMTGSRRLRIAATTQPASAPLAGGPDLDKIRRRFIFVIVIEAVAIFGAARILAGSSHSDWIPAVISAVVGFHFVPLARLFRVRLYYAAAAALCTVAGATMLFGAVGAPKLLLQLLPAFGAALGLWATGARLLVTTTADKVTP